MNGITVLPLQREFMGKRQVSDNMMLNSIVVVNMVIIHECEEVLDLNIQMNNLCFCLLESKMEIHGLAVSRLCLFESLYILLCILKYVKFCKIDSFYYLSPC